MNPACVLMCWNVPSISEDLVHELFCVAGPIEDILFGQGGKSCFIVYEHEDAVITAKEIFKDVKLNNRLLRLFDRHEIEKIYSVQEEQAAQIENYEYEDHVAHHFRDRPYDRPNFASRQAHEFQMYSSNYNTHPYGRVSNERRSGPSREQSCDGNVVGARPHFNPVNQHSFSMRNSSMAGNSWQNRSDLMPSSFGQSSHKRQFDSEDAIADLFASSHDMFGTMNPYDTPVSRSPRTPRNYHNRDDPPSNYSMNEFHRSQKSRHNERDRWYQKQQPKRSKR